MDVQCKFGKISCQIAETLHHCRQKRQIIHGRMKPRLKKSIALKAVLWLVRGSRVKKFIANPLAEVFSLYLFNSFMGEKT